MALRYLNFVSRRGNYNSIITHQVDVELYTILKIEVKLGTYKIRIDIY